MALNIMLQGTMSNAGKSLLAAGLCRIFRQDGYRVAPFKSQNMALNSFITKDGGEMGRAQVVQAEACGIVPDVRMNPILLKPTTDVGSQVIVGGKVRGNKRAYAELANYYDARALDKNEMIGIAHADNAAGAEQVLALLREKGFAGDCLNVYYEPVTGAHVGPGTVALFFYGKEK